MMRAQLLREYLDLPEAAPLSCIPVQPIKIGVSQRWDRKAIDAWLDAASGLAPSSPPAADSIGRNGAAAPDDPDAALQGWLKEVGQRETAGRA
jgi:hypothetical protein